MSKKPVQRKPKPKRTSRRKKPSPAAKTPASAKRSGFYGSGPTVRLGSVQRKVKIGPANDGYEREANAVADRVATGRPVQTPISRIGGGLAQRQQDDSVQTKRAAGEPETDQRRGRDAVEERLHGRENDHDNRIIQRQPVEDDTVQRQPAEDDTVQRPEAGDETLQAMSKDEEPVQRQPAEDDTVQRQPAEDDTVQRQEAGDETLQAMSKDEEPVQRQEAGDDTVQKQENDSAVQTKSRGGAPGRAQAANQAIQNRGGGAPLRSGTRQRLENSLGADLSGVRVHEGGQAAQSAKDLNARAFTHRNHIWLGQGESQDNLRLMAHEVTHTQQQGATPAIRRQPKPAAPAGTGKKDETPAEAPAPFDLKGMSKLTPPAAVSKWLDGQKRQRGLVPVRFGKIAAGPVLIQKKKRKKGDIFVIEKWQAVPLSHPAFAAVQIGEKTLQPSLIIRTKADGTLTGHIGIPLGKRIPKSAGQLGRHLKEAPAMLGLGGFDFPSRPKVHSKLAGGALEMGITDVPLKMGSVFAGTFTLTASDEKITTMTGNVDISVTGLAQGNMELKRNEKGLVTGQANVDLDLPKNFSGSILIIWDGTDVQGKGKVGYQGEKLSGSVTLQVMKKSMAEKLEAERKPPVEGETKGKKKKKKGGKGSDPYAVFGEGDLTFAFNDWLNGTAHVIIDHKGFVTIIGKITPQKEFTLFEQKPYRKPLPKVEARAGYGLPVLGNIFIFANVGLEAWAHLGPAKFYNIQIDGEYSNDPQKSQSFSIRGSLNISAAAGLTARGEAGAGVEIVDHDVKVGIGINGTAGIKGYAEATPIIGYREKAAKEGEDKKGEFYIRGELEMAAQPFLALSGDFFVELDSPWWSPAPDKTWRWPLGDKEWPIGDNMGLGAEVDYVFGSGKAPAMKLKPASFDGNKFMTDLVKKRTKSKSKPKEQSGKWKEKNSKAAAPPTEVKPGNMAAGKAPALPPAKPKVKAGGPRKPKKDISPKKKELKKPVPKTVKKAAKVPPAKDKKAGDKLQQAEKLKKGLLALDAVTTRYAKDGASEAEIKTGVKSVRRKFKVFKTLTVSPKGKHWIYHYVASPGEDKTGPPLAKEETAGKGKPQLKDNVLVLPSGERFQVGNEVRMRTKKKTWGRKEYFITGFSTDTISGQTFIMVRCNTRPPTLFVAKTADSYKKEWREPIEALKKLSDNRLKEENAKEDWGGDFPMAKKVLNHRHHIFQGNPRNKDWEHIVEHSAVGPNSSDNLALADRKVNQDLNHWFGGRQGSAPGFPSTREKSVRNYLKGQSQQEHRRWKERAYRNLGVYLDPQNEGRGKYQVLK